MGITANVAIVRTAYVLKPIVIEIEKGDNISWNIAMIDKINVVEEILILKTFEIVEQKNGHKNKRTIKKYCIK